MSTPVIEKPEVKEVSAPLVLASYTDPSQAKKASKKAQINAILFAYNQILMAVHTSLMSSQTSAKELNTSASNLSKVNDQQNSINFDQIDSAGYVAVRGGWSIYAIKTAGGAVHITRIVSKGGRTINLQTKINSKWVTGVSPSLAGQLALDSNYTVMGAGDGSAVEVRFRRDTVFKRATQQDMGPLQANNQQIQKERDFLSNKIVILQQCSQVEQTNLGSKDDFMAQFIQEDTNLATILSTLSNELAQLLRTP